MAHERPVNRNGGYDAWSGSCSKQGYDSVRPKSGYKRRSHTISNHDNNVDMKEDQSPNDRAMLEGYHQRNSSHRSDFTSSPSTPPYYPNAPTSPPPNPPQSSRGRRPRPPSGYRPAHSTESSYGEARDIHTPEMSSRPSSSFSVYRTLPAIGTPTPREPDLLHHNNIPKDSGDRHDPTSYPHHHQNHFSESEGLPPNANQTNHSRSSSHRIPSAVSDISVISSKPSSRRKTDDTVAAQMIERLDLSQLNRAESARRRKSSNHSNSSPSHKIKSTSQLSSSGFDSGELYDGDDDDSDSSHNLGSDKGDIYSGPPPPQFTQKQPVIIPSENGPTSADPEQNILLAIRLPTDGSRHQRYFHRQDTLQAVVEFAEEQGGQDFAGYALVSSAPKTMYEDLEQTIGDAGLEDRTVLHLEEID